MTFIKDIKRGFFAFPKGVYWLLQRPFFAVVLLIPSIIALAMMLYCLHWVWRDGGAFAESLLYVRPQNGAWGALIVYFLLWSLIQAGVLIAGSLIALVLANVFASPINEWISVNVERSVLGAASVAGGGWDSFLRVMKSELLKAVVITIASLVVLFVPGLNVLSFFAMCFLLGWNFYDYPLARRGYSFGQRFSFVAARAFSVGAFGFWLCIPFLQFFAFPFAVVGGSILCAEHIAAEAIRGK